MSYSIDLNLLLYAVDEDSPQHAKSKSFLKTILMSEEICVLTWKTVYGFLRIATHPGIFRNPLTTVDAVENIQSLLDHIRVEPIGCNQDSWLIFVRLTQEFPIKGNLIADAVVAATLETHGVKKLYTRDRDFRKFIFLKPIDPLS
jgi:toxin-antitoxin system PIN domain toxin